MIKWKGERQGKTILGLGLSRENITRLTAGNPILVHLAEVQMGDGQIFIFFGETEQDMIDELRRSVDLPPREQWHPLSPEEDTPHAQ